MSKVNAVFNEVDMLRGRLCALRVNYPDTDVRLKPAMEILDLLLSKPTQEILNLTIEEMMDLRQYFADIVRRYPDTQKAFAPASDLIDLLLGPDGETH